MHFQMMLVAQNVYVYTYALIKSKDRN